MLLSHGGNHFRIISQVHQAGVSSLGEQMSEKALKYIKKAATWTELERVIANVTAQGQFTDDVSRAIQERSTDLGIEYVVDRTGLVYAELSPAEKKIVHAIGEYAALLHTEGKHPNRTLQQIKRRGLLDAAEAAVCKNKPSQGYQVLADAELEELSYEQIVLEHPEEFSSRAFWYARKTRGIPTDTEKPPAMVQSDVSTRTTRLLHWLKGRAEANGWQIPPFKNEQAASAIGLGSLQTFGRVHGNIQSRIDFACYLCDLPPLGCAADAPFEKAWGQDGRSWAFPVPKLQQAAKSRIWSAEDFERIDRQAATLPGIAHLPWRDALRGDEQRVRAWVARWARTATSSGADSRHLERLAAEVLNRATPEYLWAAAQRFVQGGVVHDFGESTDFDVLIEGRRFAPKAVFGVALSMALGGQVIQPKHFSGGEGSTCFKLLREAGYAVVAKDQSLSDDEEPPLPDVEWTEGSRRLVPHWKRERAPGLAQAKKSQHRRLYGKLTCERCGLDPVEYFGSPLAEGCIEVHHANVQVSEMSAGHVTTLDDLQCLCANCHRFVHKQLASMP